MLSCLSLLTSLRLYCHSPAYASPFNPSGCKKRSPFSVPKSLVVILLSSSRNNQNTSRWCGPYTPTTRESSMSEVSAGPEMKESFAGCAHGLSFRAEDIAEDE